jgi:ribonuclease HII
MSPPNFDLELDCLGAGATRVAGVDEAGRGPLAGPVVAAAVVLDGQRTPPGIDDSKKLSAAAREALYERIIASATAVAVGFGSVEDIDRLNIRGATLLAMRRAVHALTPAADMALIDGNALPEGLRCDARAIIGGDALCLSIAAASIVAKVTRDRAMARLDRAHPLYGFARHQGYAVKAHLAALTRHGPCPAHRQAFAPVAAARALFEGEIKN